MKLLCFALFACAFNLLVGFSGLISFGHAAFFGVGGYAGYIIKSWGMTPELALLAATAVSATLGVAIGRLAIRSHGIYFSMVTLAWRNWSTSCACRLRSPVARTVSRVCRAASCSSDFARQ